MPCPIYRDYFVAPPWTASVDWVSLVKQVRDDAWKQLEAYPEWLTSCGVVARFAKEDLPGFDAGAAFLAADGHVYVAAVRKPALCTPRWYILHLEVPEDVRAQ